MTRTHTNTLNAITAGYRRLVLHMPMWTIENNFYQLKIYQQLNMFAIYCMNLSNSYQLNVFIAYDHDEQNSAHMHTLVRMSNSGAIYTAFSFIHIKHQ